MAQTTTKPAAACHFNDGDAVAILTYKLAGTTRNTNYRVCSAHYQTFGTTNRVAVRWLDKAAQASLEAAG